MWLRITPPKMVPRAFVSLGSMVTLSVGSLTAIGHLPFSSLLLHPQQQKKPRQEEQANRKHRHPLTPAEKGDQTKQERPESRREFAADAVETENLRDRKSTR